MRDSTPRHPACKADGSPPESTQCQELTSSSSLRCTARCTGEADSANETTADPLAAFVASLTAEQRERLARLLTGEREGGDDAWADRPGRTPWRGREPF